MSACNDIDVVCEKCGEEFQGTIWTAIHAGEDPELKDLLLGGELNILVCPRCAHTAYQDHFILYQDPPEELIAYIYPPDQRSEEDFLRKTLLLSFQEAQKTYEPEDRTDYEPILVFGLDTFVEMMRQESSHAVQSHIAEALCKENGIPFVKLRPCAARELKLMRVLPSQEKISRPARVPILKGLETLLILDPALNLYDEFRTRLTGDTSLFA